MDVDWLKEAFRVTRKDGAPGVDGQNATDFALNLDEKLKALLNRAKTSSYRAPPVRRVNIPKGSGKNETRPIGIPTFEDKVLQRAVTMMLEPIYEEEFLPYSFGFRRGKNALQAVEFIRDQIMSMKGCWIIEVDIRKFFDHIDKSHLRNFLKHRIKDGVIVKLIDKWLNAGVLEGQEMSYPDTGSPQGGVMTP